MKNVIIAVGLLAVFLVGIVIMAAMSARLRDRFYAGDEIEPQQSRKERFMSKIVRSSIQSCNNAHKLSEILDKLSRDAETYGICVQYRFEDYF